MKKVILAVVILIACVMISAADNPPSPPAGKCWVYFDKEIGKIKSLDSEGNECVFFDNPKPGCRSDAKKGYTEGFDAAVELARSSCERIVDEHRVGDCKQVLYELYKQDKPN
jgi:hypothetical protein